MLELVNIKKNYLLKDQDPVKALRGVSLNFRQNEFVAILGPSGCGKTTLLNIIGGLDRYSAGDLIIKGKSTKHYNDHDWDTYRNHSVGFVFQAYNLIGHQSICKNVELALTIGGVSRKERKQRAYKALEKVGLKGMEKKKPNQLSGGQMQRVAIARALVNDPEILLADEPTGALDSEMSIQIMDLLKEVAHDRLVIMVTHNPDLAAKYATRIVNIIDGKITGDTNPYHGEDENKKAYRCPKCGTIIKQKLPCCPNCQVKAKYPKDDVDKNKQKHSSMSFLTATLLSLSNLISKAKRTVLVAIAGSIGIFGVSTVLAASYGVRQYIAKMQDDMLSSYPLTISEQTVDYMSLMTGLYSDTDPKLIEFDTTTEVGLNSMIDYLVDRYADFTSVKTNTINDDLVEYINEIPKEYLSALSFNYGVDLTNNIFTSWKEDENASPTMISLNGLTQRYIAELQTVDGFAQYASYFDLFTDFMQLLPAEEEYILSQYDLLGNSHFPQNDNEIMLVVGEDTTLTDLVFGQLGYYNEDEFLNICKKAVEKHTGNGSKSDEQLDDEYPYPSSFTYDELLNKKFYYYPHDTIYHYADIPVRPYQDFSIVLRNAANTEFYSLTYSSNSSNALLKGIIYTGTHIKLSPFSYENIYAIKMKDGFSPSDLLPRPDEDYDPDVRDFIADPETDPDPSSGTFIAFNSTDARKIISGASASELSSIALMNIGTGLETTATVNYLNLFSCSKTIVDQMETVTGYQYPAEVDPSWTNKTEISVAGILRPKKGVSFGSLSRGVYFTKGFQDKYMEDAKNSQIIKDATYGYQAFIDSGAASADTYKAYVTFNYTNFADPDNPIRNNFGYISCLNGDLSNSFSSIFSSITGVDYMNQNSVFLRSLSGLKAVAHSEDDGPTTYTYEKLPDTMSIYPVNFKQKDKVTDYLDKWNSKEDITLYQGTTSEKILTAEMRDELTYDDTISLIIATIDAMITIVTTALVIFTSLSLVVSSFMIAVITYISVMERVKEIGVIRSLGGRKKDVSRLFIAENLVTGLLSGIIGIALTLVACIIVNLVIAPFGVPNIAILTVPTALIMIALSIFLSVMAGLIPSMHASRQDPVTALRSE